MWLYAQRKWLVRGLHVYGYLLYLHYLDAWTFDTNIQNVEKRSKTSYIIPEPSGFLERATLIIFIHIQFIFE